MVDQFVVKFNLTLHLRKSSKSLLIYLCFLSHILCGFFTDLARGNFHQSLNSIDEKEKSNETTFRVWKFGAFPEMMLSLYVER